MGIFVWFIRRFRDALIESFARIVNSNLYDILTSSRQDNQEYAALKGYIFDYKIKDEFKTYIPRHMTGAWKFHRD